MDFENRILLGDCLEVLRALPPNTYDACVSDVPYGLGTKEPSVEGIIAYLQGADLDMGGDFMSHDWNVPSVAVWKEVFRILKPGGHVVAFGGTRTFDLISLGLRAAGFQNRDTVAEFGTSTIGWVYGSGMPKSMNVSKAMDKMGGTSVQAQAAALKASRLAKGLTYEDVAKAVGSTPSSVRDWEEGRARREGAPLEWIVPSPKYRKKLAELLGYTDDERKVVGESQDRRGDGTVIGLGHSGVLTEGGQTDLSKEWEGWGTGLKPSWEPILLFRKPLQGTVAENVITYRTGAINIDGCRVRHSSPEDFAQHAAGVQAIKDRGGSMKDSWKNSSDLSGANDVTDAGRWPANAVFVHTPGCQTKGSVIVEGYAINRFTDGAKPFGNGAGHPYESTRTADEEVPVYDCTEGCPVKALNEQSGDRPSTLTGRADPSKAHVNPGDNGGASLFGGGNSNVYADSGGAARFFKQFDMPFRYVAKTSAAEKTLEGQLENRHPTTKPVELMSYLVRLVTPKGGLVLDPYCGSGSTLHAAVEEGCRYTGIDISSEFHALATKRLEIVTGKVQERQDQLDIFELAMSLSDG